MAAFFVVGHHAEIDNEERIAGWIESSRDRTFETAAAHFRGRAIFSAFVNGEIFDDPIFNIYPHHLRAHRVQHLANRGSLITEQSDERFARMAKGRIARE